MSTINETKSLEPLRACLDLQESIEAVENVGSKNLCTDSQRIAEGYCHENGNTQTDTAEQEKVLLNDKQSSVTARAGSYADGGMKLQEKTATPSKVPQDIIPDDGYNGLSKIIVEAIPENYADVTQVTATKEKVMAGILFVDSKGQKAAGTISDNGAISDTIDSLHEKTYVIPEGYHNGSGTVSLGGEVEAMLSTL